MKKRLLAAIMAVTLAVGGAFGFVACGDDKPTGDNQGNNTEQEIGRASCRERV